MSLPTPNSISSKQVSVPPDFTNYQRSILNNLGYYGLTRQRIDKESQWSYQITTGSSLAQSFFYVTVANSLIKLVYIAYIINDQFTSLEFLDRIAAVLYMFLFGIMTLSYSIWLRRYPLYEILHRSWTIQNQIFQRLGQPPKLQQEVDRLQKATVRIHLGISWVGCVCFLIQYYADPTYYTFTYAILGHENSILFAIFGVHECLFMHHAWSLMISSNGLFTFEAVALSKIIDEMSKAVQTLCIQKATGFKKKKAGNNENDVTGNSYDIEQIMFDYKQLMMITEMYNASVSYKTVFLHACGYFQFISDVFLAVQVLRLPGTGVFDIWFYIEDSMASMYMIYRVYEFMSRVEPSSRQFFLTLTHYLGKINNHVRRKRLHKTIKTLRLVSMKIGPCPVRRSTVLAAMEILGNYYICVALW